MGLHKMVTHDRLLGMRLPSAAHALVPIQMCLPQGKAGAGDPDAEARAAAVRALTAVASELCPLRGPPRSPVVHALGPVREPASDDASGSRAGGAVAAAPRSVVDRPRRAAAGAPGTAPERATEGAASDRAGDAAAQSRPRAALEHAAVAACDSRASGAGDAAAARLLLERVAPALLAAMGDYATDARGDVGSWVRLVPLPSCVSLCHGAFSTCMCGLLCVSTPA